MSSEKSERNESRRSFLKGLVVGGAAVGVAAGSGVMAAEPAPTADYAESSSSKVKGYQETAHVRRFYDLARS